MACERELGDGLSLRTVRDERDVQRFADFHTTFVSRTEGLSCAHLLRHHPEICYDDFLIIEDLATGELVSTVCLIPWHLDFEGVALDAAMLEMVLTHPDYRRRGLIRIQIECFHRMVRERNFDLCVIEGIPYYYRQFGYAYACDHWRRDSLPTGHIPDHATGDAEPFGLRSGRLDEIPALAELYDQTVGRLGLHTRRSPAFWRFLLETERYPVHVVTNPRNEAVVGYIAVLPAGTGGVLVAESAVPDCQVGMSVLRQLKHEIGTGEIQLGWPQSATLVQFGRSLGARPVPGYQWLVRIPGVAGLLGRLGPVFERRLAHSDCAGLTRVLTVNLFREAFALCFEGGNLSWTKSLGFVDSSMGADGGDLCIPPDAFVRLVLGYRGLDELRDAWPDIQVKPGSRPVLDALFPKVESYIWMPYMYYGPL